MADYYYLEGFTLADLPDIPCDPSDRPTATAGANTGIAVSYRHLAAVRRSLGLRLLEYWPEYNTNRSIVALTIPDAVQAHGRGWVGYSLPTIRRWLGLWAPYFGRPFNVYRSDFRGVMSTHRGWTVMVDSGLGVNRLRDNVRRPTTPTYTHPENWGDDYHLIKVDGEVVAAYIDSRVLYLFAVGISGWWWHELLRQLPSNRAVAVPPPPPDYENLYIELRTKGYEAQKQNLVGQLQSTRNDIVSYQEALVGRMQDEAKYIRQLRAYEEPDKKEEELKDEFVRLKAVEGIKNVVIAGSAVVAETHTIIVEADGDTWDLGAFRITIGTNGRIRIINQRAKEVMKGTSEGFYNDIQHPHVYDGGAYVCLGNLQTPVTKLIGAGDFPTALAVLVKFLNHINEKEHDGIYITRLRAHWNPVGVEPKKEGKAPTVMDYDEALEELVALEPAEAVDPNTGTTLRWDDIERVAGFVYHNGDAGTTVTTVTR